MTDAAAQSEAAREAAAAGDRDVAFSIVIPVRDEEDNVEVLLEEVEAALGEAAGFEVIVVDDGSGDRTLERLRSLARRLSRLRVLRHRRGCGQSAAIATGVRAARGEWIVTMDGDGQNDPADIDALLDRLSGPGPEPDMVVGWRRHRKDPWVKRAASWVANGIYRALLSDDTPDVGCGLKVFRRETFLALPSFDHMHRFLPALVRRNGGRVESVVVRHRPRREGRSKYGVVDRLLVGVVDILGVGWLQMRAARPEWEETTDSGPAHSAPAPTPTSAPPLPREDEKLPRGATFLLLVLALFLVFGRISDLPLLDPDEGRNAEVAREMAVSGRWLVPTYDGLPYLDKPAFYFKVVGLSFSLFGVSEGAARLPSALFASALLALVYGFCRREYGARTAILAVAIVAAMPLFEAFSRIVIFDMPLAFFVSLAIFAGYRASELEGRNARLAYAVGAAAAGGATLTKGPVGFIVPALVLLVLARVERRSGVLRAMVHPVSLGVFLLTVLPWFLGVSLQRPDFPYYGLVRESFERFTQPTFQRQGPLYYYVPVIASVCFAWSVLLPGAARLAWRLRGRLQRADRLFIVWAVTVVIFFSLSQSKLPGYVLTAVVAFGVLLARLFSRALAAPGGRAAGVVFRGAVVLAVVNGLVALGLAYVARDSASAALGFEGFRIPHAVLEAIAAPLLATLAVMSVVALFGRVTKRVALVLAAFLLFPLSLWTVGFGALRVHARESSSEALAREVRALSPRTTVACFRCFPPGLRFYLGRTLYLVSDDGSETTSNYIPFYLSLQHDWPPQVVPVSRLSGWLRSRRRPILILAAEDGLSALRALEATEGGSLRSFPGGFRGLFLGRASGRPSS